MSLDSSDLVDYFLTEQARINSAVANEDINSLVADFQAITGELIGLVETIGQTTMGVSPHLTDDGQTAVGYFAAA